MTKDDLDYTDQVEQERPIIDSIDAHAWAAHFKNLYPNSDEALMVTWFSSSMMAMYDYLCKTEINQLLKENEILKIEVLRGK